MNESEKWKCHPMKRSRVVREGLANIVTSRLCNSVMATTDACPY